jgi:hypothetical protein
MGVLVLVLVVLLILREESIDVDELLRDAPAAVDEQGSARLEMSIEAGGEDGAAVDVTGEGGVEFDSGAGWFVVQLVGQEVEMRNDDTTLYVRRAGDAEWVSTTAGAAGSLGAGPSQASAIVDLLRGDLDDVEDLGAEEIGSGAARHLRITVDAADVDEQLAALAGDDGALELDVWIDERRLPVRLRLDGAVQGVPIAVTVDLSGWGDPLGVDIPPTEPTRPVAPDELAALFGGTAS